MHMANQINKWLAIHLALQNKLFFLNSGYMQHTHRFRQLLLMVQFISYRHVYLYLEQANRIMSRQQAALEKGFLSYLYSYYMSHLKYPASCVAFLSSQGFI